MRSISMLLAVLIFVAVVLAGAGVWIYVAQIMPNPAPIVQNNQKITKPPAAKPNEVKNQTQPEDENETADSNSVIMAGAGAEEIVGISPENNSVSNYIDKFRKFVTYGYQIKTFVEGDLNGDGIPDAALVIERADDEKSNLNPAYCSDGQCECSKTGKCRRELVLLFGKKDGGYNRSLSSDKAILLAGGGGVFGDPLEIVSINNGILIIKFYGGSAWRWLETYKFRYQNNGWYLIGKTQHDYYSRCPYQVFETKDYNYLTGYMQKTIGDGWNGYNFKENFVCDETLRQKSGKEEWVNVGVKSLLKLEDFDPRTFGSIEKFTNYIPDNWGIVNFAEGDLNNDGINDAALSIQEKCDSMVMVCENKLLILFGNATGYKLVMESDKAIENKNPQMSNDAIEIKNNLLSITYYSGSSSGAAHTTYNFVYQNGGFYLVKKHYQTFFPRAELNNGASQYCPDNAFITYEDYNYESGTFEKFTGPLVGGAYSFDGQYLCVAGDENKKGTKEIMSIPKKGLINLNNFDPQID